MFSRSSIPFKVYSTALCGGVLIAKKTAYVQIIWGPKNVETLSILDSSGNLRERKKYMKKNREKKEKKKKIFHSQGLNPHGQQTHVREQHNSVEP